MESPRYLHGHHASVLHAHARRTVDDSASYLLPQLQNDQRLLDIGAGPGTITAGLADRVASVVAIEVDEATLNVTRSGVQRPNVTFEVGDVHSLQFTDDAFDVVHAHQVLQHVADPVQALREMRRVCRPGGVIAARDVDYSSISIYPLLPELADWLTLYRRLARLQGGEPDAGPRLLSWARAAGCSEVTPSASVWCYATESDRAHWGETWAARATESRFAEVAVADGVAPERLAAIADGWRRWAADPDGWITLTHGEIIARP